jgi:hypothetical protein
MSREKAFDLITAAKLAQPYGGLFVWRSQEDEMTLRILEEKCDGDMEELPNGTVFYGHDWTIVVLRYNSLDDILE